MTIVRNKDLTAWNTFGLKVSCACFVEYGSVAELEELWKRNRDGLGLPETGGAGDGTAFPSPILHIGRGSNLLFTKDFPGTVFHSDIKFIEAGGESCGITAGETAGDRRTDVEVGAGVLWDDFCRWSAEQGLWGPENLSGIPGETGAAAVQNIGAYGVEAKDFIRMVKCFDCITGKVVAFRPSECRYGYRESMFKTSAKGRYVVTSVCFSLSSGPNPKLEYGNVRAAVDKALEDTGKSLTPALVRDVILSVRNSKLPDPAVIGSAGSFFKNPVVPRSDYERVASIARIGHSDDCQVPHFDTGSGFIKIPAAWLIDQCGLKGYRDGNAAVYERQPLVIVNLTGEASPEEILAVEKKVSDSVYSKFGIRLQPEVEHI